MDSISWQDFEKIHLCVGTIVAVDDFPLEPNRRSSLRDEEPQLGELCDSVNAKSSAGASLSRAKSSALPSIIRADGTRLA